jgi:putative hydrolase of the HAD superfamily
VGLVLPACVILDLDDTLFLERDYVISGLRAVGKLVQSRVGRAGFAQIAIGLFENGVRGDTFNRALAELGIRDDAALVGELVAAYRCHEPAITLEPDAARLVARLRGRYVGVVTDGPLESQRAKARAVGAPGWTSLVICTAELGSGFAKPHPRAFAMHQTAAGRRGAECVYIADNPAKDFAGPKSLGWATVRLRRAQSLHAGLPSDGLVDDEIVSLDELATVPTTARAAG